MGKKIAWTWVKGHSGDHFNELCDRIAKEEAETAARQGKAGFRETRGESQDNDSENAADTQPAREAGPSGPGTGPGRGNAGPGVGLHRRGRCHELRGLPGKG